MRGVHWKKAKKKVMPRAVTSRAADDWTTFKAPSTPLQCNAYLQKCTEWLTTPPANRTDVPFGPRTAYIGPAPSKMPRNVGTTQDRSYVQSYTPAECLRLERSLPCLNPFTQRACVDVSLQTNEGS